MNIEQAIAAIANIYSTARMAVLFYGDQLPRHNTYSKCVRLAFASNQSPSMAAPACVMPQFDMLPESVAYSVRMVMSKVGCEINLLTKDK